MSVDIVIVNWNSGELLKECVDSVLMYGGSCVCSIVVVDNDSSDGSENFLEDQLSVKLIRARTNLGFGKACNLGATHCNSEFILFLNPDARIFDDTLSKVRSFMVDKDNTNIGICGVKLYDEYGDIARSCSRAPTGKAYFSKALGLTKIVPSLGTAMSEWNHLETRIVDQVIGAFFFREAQFISQIKRL
jgi:GT2 family glycosyltransferase